MTKFDGLSPREREVMRGFALGHTNARIAEVLGVSPKTIDTHRTHAFKKLGVTNNVQLARLAIREGFVELHSDAWTDKEQRTA